MAEEGEIGIVVNEMDDDLYDYDRVCDVEEETEMDDDADSFNKATDTTAKQARKGKDRQGIPWERLNVTRDKYWKTRIELCKNYENIPSSGELINKVEGIVKQLAISRHPDRITDVISVLITEFTYSPQENHRKGGLIGLAAATVGLTT